MENAFNDETLLARWLADELTPEELAAFRQREDYAELESIVQELNEMSMPPFSEKASWEKLREAVKKEASPSNSAGDTSAHSEKTVGPANQPVRRIRIGSILAAAAAVLLLIAGYWWFTAGGQYFDTTLATAAGEQKEVTLPDGSTVLLNAVSEIGFSADEWPADRVVSLKGEAFFQARKGNTFTVLTDQGIVEVVGTAFNVFARDYELEVKCTEGIVRVINPKQTERVLLKAGEQVEVKRGRMQQRKGIYFSPRWFKGESSFQGAPLDKVFEELERQFAVTVVMENLDDRKFSGKIKHGDIEKALKIICDPMQLEYELNGDTVRVH